MAELLDLPVCCFDLRVLLLGLLLQMPDRDLRLILELGHAILNFCETHAEVSVLGIFLFKHLSTRNDAL